MLEISSRAGNKWDDKKKQYNKSTTKVPKKHVGALATGWTSARAAPRLLSTVEFYCWTPVYTSGLEARPRLTPACIHNSVTVADDGIKIKFFFFRRHVVDHHLFIWFSQKRLRDFREYYNIVLEQRRRHTNTVSGIGVERTSSLCVVPSETTPSSATQRTSSADFKVLP